MAELYRSRSGMPANLFSMALPILLAGCAPASTSACLDVAAPHAKVSLEGRLTLADVTDPYGTERVFILTLAEPICIDDGGEFADPSEQFREAHISSNDAVLLQALRTSVGRNVGVSGEGFAAHTRHHRAPLVILADSITNR
jgi:hypothetical protein